MGQLKKVTRVIFILIIFINLLIFKFYQANVLPVVTQPLSVPTPIGNTLKTVPMNVTKKPPSEFPNWNAFKAKFGSDLQSEFTPDGKLIAIHGTIGSGQFANSDFRPNDPEKVIMRAREVIHEGRPLLGVRSNWPLDQGVAKEGSISAQVFFNETYDGIPLAPVGSVKVDLGSKGELIALYSDYTSDVHIRNKTVLSQAQAQLKAFSSKDSGSKVIWVMGQDAYYAYRFMVQGHQIIIDAQTGQVLSRRDQRQF